MIKAHIGVDLGGTFIRFAYLPTSVISNVFEGFTQIQLLSESTLEKISEFLEDYFKAKKIIPETICFGIPGVLDLKRTKIIDIPNRPVLKDKDFKTFFNRKFKCRIFLEKDVNLILLKNLIETKFIKNSNLYKNILGFYVGTGFGHALYIKNEIFIGSHGWSGEIGHIKFPEITKTCSCGQVGCVEAEYSGAALQKYQKRHYPKITIDKIFTKYSNDLFLQRYVKGLAKVMSVSIAIIDPEIIILGGGVINLSYFPKDELKKEILNCYRIPKLKHSIKIIFNKQNEKNGTYGACLYARQQTKKKP